MRTGEAHKGAPPRVDVRGAFIRRTDWSNVILRGADLSGADASGAAFRNTDFAGARLTGTILRGADLTGALNLTIEQLSSAILDESTLLPPYIDRAKILLTELPVASAQARSPGRSA